MDTAGLPELIADQEFSGVVLVKRGNATVFESVTGAASPRWGIPNTLDTRFDTAGITKLFTSVAVLQLVARGDLDLETSIHHYVDLEGSSIPVGVTLLQLLTHTSGIADDADEQAGESYDELYRRIPNYTLTQTADQLPLFAHKPPLDEPGTAFGYSDAGYVLAGLAIERVTGRAYRQVVFDEVFQRAGMLDAGFYDRREAAPRVAEGWDRDDDGTWVANIYATPPIGSPDAGAHVTAPDLLRFLTALRDGELLDREFTEEFLVPQVAIEPGAAVGFGLEFDLHDDGGVRSYFKEGGHPGASGILRHYLDEGLDIVVLSNSEEGAWPIIQDLDERLGG